MKISWAPSDWKIYKIGDVLKRVSIPVTVEEKTIYREIGIRSHGKGIFHKQETTGAAIGNKRVFWVEPSCFIVNIVFAWEGAVTQTTDPEEGMIASHRFPMYKPVDGLLDLDFITYFFQSQRGNHLLRLASPGGAGRNKTLGQQAFSELEIPLPPLAAQKEIGAILRDSDEVITLTDQLIEAKQTFKKGLMQQILTGKMRFPGFEGEWEEIRIKDIAQIHYGKSPNQIRDANGIYPIYGTSGIVGSTNTILCNPPAVIIGRKGTIDQPRFVEQPFWAIDTTFYCLPKGNVEIGWVYYMLDHLKLARYNEATGVPSLSRSNLYRIKLCLPPVSEQKKIASILAACDDEIFLLQRKAAALREQKKGLMQQLLTGKVRV